MVEVEPDGSSQNNFFQVAALPNQILQRIPMADADDILSDDGPIIELGRNVMAGCADQLDFALIGLPLRVRPDKRRKE